MISDEILFGLFIGPFYSIAAPILAYLYCRRRFHLAAGDIGLGVVAAVVSQNIISIVPFYVLVFALTPHGFAPYFKLLGSALAKNMWIVLVHQALRYTFFRFLAHDATDSGPGIAYGIGVAIYACLSWAWFGWTELSHALAANADNVLAVFGPDYAISSIIVDRYFWSGVPLATQAAANLLLEIGLAALAWRARRLKSLKLLGLGLILDFTWRVPIALDEARRASFYPAFYYQWLGLLVTLGFLLSQSIARRRPHAFQGVDRQWRPSSPKDKESPGLFAVWRNQTLKDEDV
jgi:uncharacterized membrane protein YhfC